MSPRNHADSLGGPLWNSHWSQIQLTHFVCTRKGTTSVLAEHRMHFSTLKETWCFCAICHEQHQDPAITPRWSERILSALAFAGMKHIHTSRWVTQDKCVEFDQQFLLHLCARLQRLTLNTVHCCGSNGKPAVEFQSLKNRDVDKY